MPHEHAAPNTSSAPFAARGRVRQRRFPHAATRRARTSLQSIARATARDSVANNPPARK